MNYKIRLDETVGGHRKVKVDCPYCKARKRFTRYYNFEANEYPGELYGRCDRQETCGAHVSPPRQKGPLKSNVWGRIDPRTVAKSFQRYEINPFAQYLFSQFDEDEVYAQLAKYEVGTSKAWGGATIFWQRDAKGAYRSGKVMGYDKKGHRKANETTWAHSLMKMKDFQLEQCFFGEHLLKDAGRDEVVAIFESEKTAILYDMYCPDQYVCLACGNSNGMGGKSLNREKCRPLRGREVLLFPDSSKGDIFATQWENLAQQMQESGINAQVVRWDEEALTEQQKGQGLDVADLLGESVYLPESLIQHEQPEKAFYLPF